MTNWSKYNTIRCSGPAIQGNSTSVDCVLHEFRYILSNYLLASYLISLDFFVVPALNAFVDIPLVQGFWVLDQPSVESKFVHPPNCIKNSLFLQQHHIRHHDEFSPRIPLILSTNNDSLLLTGVTYLNVFCVDELPSLR